MTSSNRKVFTNIPLLSKDLLDKLNVRRQIDLHVGGHSYHPHLGDTYIQARLFLQGLYQTGAVLMNNGWAYVEDAKIKQTIIFGMEDDRSLPVNLSNQRAELLAQYHSLKTLIIDSVDGASPLACNPLHAIFVIKVALDHLEPNFIIENSKRLIEDALNMKYTHHIDGPTFANGSRFHADSDAATLLARYIVHNPRRFPEHASYLAELSRDINNPHYLIGSKFCIYGSIPRSDSNKAAWQLYEINRLLGRKLCRPVSLTSLFAGPNEFVSQPGRKNH